MAAEWEGVPVIAPGGKLNSIFNILRQGRAKKRALPFFVFSNPFFICYHEFSLPSLSSLKRLCCNCRIGVGGRDYDTVSQKGRRNAPKEDWILKEEEIAAKLKEAAKEGKISCALAQKIAIENKISMKQVGNLLNKMKIKIAQCQLGCF
jgi:hypothetical protein